MEITINDSRKIFAIQKEFSDMFPCLKLEFFAKAHSVGGYPSSKLMKHISKTIGECRTIHSSGFITIQPQMTLGELEQSFRDIYGLSIEVFRKSAGAWLGIGEAANLSLEKHNHEASLLTNVKELI